MEKTRNEKYGFYGTMSFDGCADEAWEIAMREICLETGAEPEEVRDFLDSRWGRHFADTIHCFLDKGPLDEAIRQSIRKWNGWKLSPRRRRELDIPDQLPYLTSLVYAAWIEAQ